MSGIPAETLVDGDRRRILATAIWSCLIVTTVVLMSRKLSGAFSRDLPMTVACCWTTLTVAFSLVANFLFQAGRPTPCPRWGQIAAGVITLVPPFAMGITLLPGHSIGAASYLAVLFLIASCAVLAVGEIAFSQRARAAGNASPAAGLIAMPKSRGSETIQPGCSAPSQVAPEEVASVNSRQMFRILAEQASHDRSTLSQWMTRTTDPEGCERVSGEMTIELPAGRKHTSIHVPFCPPLPGTPDVRCDLLGDTPIRLKIAAVLPYGVRIEAKRTGPCDMGTVFNVRISATAVTARPKAA